MYRVHQKLPAKMFLNVNSKLVFYIALLNFTLSVNRFIGLVNVSYYWSKHNQFSYLVLTFSVSIIRDLQLHQMKVFGRDRNFNKVRKSVVFWCLIYDISTTVVDLLIIWPVHHITKHRNWMGPTPSILKIGWDASLSSLLVIAPLGVLTPDRNDFETWHSSSPRYCVAAYGFWVQKGKG